MNAGIHHWLQLIKPDLKLFLWISIGAFLFILFFQPFPLVKLDFNNLLLFNAGLGAILFILMLVARSFFPYDDTAAMPQESHRTVPGLFRNISLLIAGSVAFAFYLRYVGHIEITFFIMFKVVFICLIPPVVISICDAFRDARKDISRLRDTLNAGSPVKEPLNNTNDNSPLTFTSDSSSDHLKLFPADVVFIKSADNYVEIAYKEDGIFKKQLLRTTLKKIEEQLQTNSDFIRCHRICIVNIHHIKSLENKNQNYWLVMDGFEETIPVSRQYLLMVKDRL